MLKKTIGLIIIACGLLLLLSNLELVSFDGIARVLFPLALVIIGIVGLIEKKRFDFVLSLFIIIGSLYFLANIDVIELKMVNNILGPIVIVTVGVGILFSVTRKMISTKPVTSYTAIFGGVEDKNESSEYLSSEVMAIFGGADIDYRKIKIKEDKAYIDATVVFGGATLILPEDIKVTVKGLPIFGGAENKAVSKDGAKKEIIITYTAIFGAIEIKN